MAEKKTKIKRESKPLVSILIVNYKTKKITADTIDSILADISLTRTSTKDKIKIEIILVDNNSNDGSVSYLKKRFKNQVQFIQTKRNIGFGPANNLAANSALGRYLFFLNSDTLVQEQCIEKIVRFLDGHPEYGVVGPKVLLKNKKDIQPASFGKFPSLSRVLFRNSTVKRPRLDERFVCTNTDWVTGAAMMIPAEIFWAVGGFDPRFFMYFEDQDLCADIKKLGFQTAVLNDAEMIHLVGKSMKKSKQKYAIYDNSQEQYYLKHYGWLKTSLMVTLRWPWKIIRALR